MWFIISHWLYRLSYHIKNNTSFTLEFHNSLNDYRANFGGQLQMRGIDQLIPLSLSPAAQRKTRTEEVIGVTTANPSGRTAKLTVTYCC